MIDLTKREKLLLMVLGGVVVSLALYFFIISPLIGLKSQMSRGFAANMDKLNKLDQIYGEYREVKQKRANFESLLRSEKGTTTIIEENAESAGIRRNKVYTQDRPSNIQGPYKKITTDVRFEGVDIKSLMNFIYKMENSNKLIVISYIKINQALKGRNLYDVAIKFDSLSAQ